MAANKMLSLHGKFPDWNKLLNSIYKKTNMVLNLENEKLNPLAEGSSERSIFDKIYDCLRYPSIIPRKIKHIFQYFNEGKQDD